MESSQSQCDSQCEESLWEDPPLRNKRKAAAEPKRNPSPTKRPKRSTAVSALTMKEPYTISSDDSLSGSWLPAEIWDHIMGYLSLSSVTMLMATCKLRFNQGFSLQKRWFEEGVKPLLADEWEHSQSIKTMEHFVEDVSINYPYNRKISYRSACQYKHVDSNKRRGKTGETYVTAKPAYFGQECVNDGHYRKAPFTIVFLENRNYFGEYVRLTTKNRKHNRERQQNRASSDLIKLELLCEREEEKLEELRKKLQGKEAELDDLLSRPLSAFSDFHLTLTER